MLRENSEKGATPKLQELITKEAIILKAFVSDWKDAIKKAGEILVKIGAVEPRYISAMIEFTKKLGPYIVITKGVALPHARPEDGVLKPCFSILTLRKPVEFGNVNNDPVDLVIGFGARDNSSHLKALAQLAKLLQNKEDTNMIRSANNSEEVLDVLKKYD